MEDPCCTSFRRFPQHDMIYDYDNITLNELSPFKKKKVRKVGSRRPRGQDSYHKTNLPEARCAYFHRTKEEWRARYVEDTKRKMKCFSLKRYKNEHALTLAECFLSEMQRTHKVPQDEDINIWYAYLLRMANNNDPKSDDLDEEQSCKPQKEEDAKDDIFKLIREQRTHSWIAEGSIPHVPPVGPWGKSQLLREVKNKTLPNLHTNPEIFTPQNPYPDEKLRLEKNLAGPDPHIPIKKPLDPANLVKNEKFVWKNDVARVDGNPQKFYHRLPSKFEPITLSNMRYHKKSFLRQNHRNFLPLELNLESMNKRQSPSVYKKYKPSRQIIKPHSSNGIRLPRSPSLPPEPNEYEDVQNSDFLLSQLSETLNPLDSNVTNPKHPCTSLSSVITRCAKSRRKFWDMRYSKDLNYKNTHFDNIEIPISDKLPDNTCGLEAKVISIAKSLDSFEPPQHLLQNATSMEPNHPNEIRYQQNTLKSIDPLSLQAPIINFELLSKINSNSSAPRSYYGDPENPYTFNPQYESHFNKDNFPFSLLGENKVLKESRNKNLETHCMKLDLSNSIQSLNLNSKDSSNLDKHQLSNYTSLNENTLKTESIGGNKGAQVEELTALIKSCAKPSESGLSNLVKLLNSEMTEKEIEVLLINQLSRPDFPTSEVDLEQVLSLSQMEEHNASTTVRLKYLRTLDEQLVRTLLEQENLHMALYFYSKLKNMKTDEIELFKNVLANNCDLNWKDKLSNEPIVQDIPKEMSDTQPDSALPTNDIEEMLNLESLHIFSEALMDEKQRILDTLFNHMNSQLEKLNLCIPQIFDNCLSKILKGDCYLPQGNSITVKEEIPIENNKLQETFRGQTQLP